MKRKSGKKWNSWRDDSDLISLPFVGGILALSALIIAAYIISGWLGLMITVSTATLVLLAMGWLLNEEDEAGTRRGSQYLLLVANRALSDPRLQEEVLLREDRRVAIVAPIQARSLLAALANDIDQELRDSYQRLDSFEMFARQNDIAVSKQVSIQRTPLQSAKDGMRQLPVGEIVIATTMEERWGEDLHKSLAGIPLSVIYSLEQNNGIQKR